MKKIRLVGLSVLIIGIFIGFGGCKSEVQNKDSKDGITSGFEDELFLDSMERHKMDSMSNAMEQPAVLNREIVKKSLKPNKDNVIMLDWNITNDIKLEECFNEQLGEYFYCPEFGSIMKSLEGKIVAINGYTLPLEEGYFALSMNPMASCYFCGGGGPQSIIDLKFNSPRAFKMDQRLTFKGKLRLNATNLDELFYILDNAEVYEE